MQDRTEERAEAIGPAQLPLANRPIPLPGCLGSCGVLLFMAGLWFLVVSPNAPTEWKGYPPGSVGAEFHGLKGEPLPPVVSLQKLALGQALLVAGAILIAAQWRPR